MGDLAETAGLLAGMAQAQQANGGDEEQARFDEEFAAVEPMDRVIFQAGISEQAVPKECCGREINGEVKGFPEMAAETDAQVGSGDDKCKQVESDCADAVVEGLGRRMFGIDEVEDEEARIFV